MPEEVQMYKKPPSLEKLSRNLYMASHMAGFSIIMDGDSSKKKNNQNHKQYPLGSHSPLWNMNLLCQHYQKYKIRKAVDSTLDLNGQFICQPAYKDVSLHNDKKGNS